MIESDVKNNWDDDDAEDQQRYNDEQKKYYTKNMKTYILKRLVCNHIDFPIGTIVKVNDPKWEFEVVEGELKGEKGHIADGVYGWIVDDTEENRTLIQRSIEQQENLFKQLKQNCERIENITNAVRISE